MEKTPGPQILYDSKFEDIGYASMYIFTILYFKSKR